MKIDLSIGAYLQIGGELGKYNSIPIDVLAKLASDLQNLIFTIARYDLPSNESITLENFKIELIDFKKGSAVPKFAYSRRSETMTGQNWQVHRQNVNEKLEKLIEVSDKGDYSELSVIYPEPHKRNPIVENLYEFVNDFGNAPVAFVDYSEKDESVTPLYKIHRFKPAVKKSLIAEIDEPEEEIAESNDGVARIKITRKKGKTKRTIVEQYTQKQISLNYSPDIIVYGKTKYILNHPLRCLFEKEDDFYVIQSELLGIIGTGDNEDDAEQAFSEEFNYIYTKYNSLKEEEMTNKIKVVKAILNQLVKRVEK